MYELMIYNLKVGVCLAVFYLFFKLLLSRETFHRLNRILILGVMLLAFVLPFCVVTVCVQVPALSGIPAAVDPDIVPVADAAVAASFPWDVLAGWVFLTGIAATLGLTCFSLWSVLRVIHRGRHERLDDGIVLVYSDRPGTPFSWGRYIVLSEQDAAENGDAILLHERSHVELRHSWDLLITDIAGCLQWFNPAMWLLRRELRAIHEYEADEAVLKKGVDARRYQLLLVRKVAAVRWRSLANSFNRHTLKNRITMMLRQKSSRWAAAKALLFLPLVGFALGAFAETVYVFPEDGKMPPILISGTSRADAPAEAAPLYIADGRVFEPSDSLLPRIESLHVLGDSATLAHYAAQYGDRAKNGVVLVELREPGAPLPKTTESKVRMDDVVVVAFGGSEHAASRRQDAALPEEPQHPLDTGKLDDIVVVGFGNGQESDFPWKMLYVVDGKIRSDAELATLDEGTIQTISVLNGDTAEKKYGRKGYASVVEITTGPDTRPKAYKTAMRRGSDCLLRAQQAYKLAVETGDPDEVRRAAVKAEKYYRAALRRFGKALEILPGDKAAKQVAEHCSLQLKELTPVDTARRQTY